FVVHAHRDGGMVEAGIAHPGHGEQEASGKILGIGHSPQDRARRGLRNRACAQPTAIPPLNSAVQRPSTGRRSNGVLPALAAILSESTIHGRTGSTSAT